MKPIIVQFQQVHHVHRNRATRSSPKHTVFSFMADFCYTPYVTVPGFPRLEPGMKVQALLERDGDWKSLVGWRDLDTGALASPDPDWHLYRILFLIAWIAVAAVFAIKLMSSASTGQVVGAGFASLAVLALAAYEYTCWQRTKLRVRALSAIPSPANEA